MKQVLTFLSIFFGVSLSYYLGERKGLNINESCIQNDVAERYIKIIGNPSTQEQQCKFDYIIYNDSAECK